MQCCFRSRRSTVDHLVRFETFYREAFIHNQHLVSVFFDLENAYDTTWKYGIMKDLKDCANFFLLPKQTAAYIVNKGCQAKDVIFGGTRTDSLSSLRYNVLGKINSLFPILRDTRTPTAYRVINQFHCQRVYYQIMIWLGQESDMDTCEWGWKREGSQFVPTESDMNAAPYSLLKIATANAQLPVALPGVAVGRNIYPVPRLVDST